MKRLTIGSTLALVASLAGSAAPCPPNRCDDVRMIIGCDDRVQKPHGEPSATTAPWRHVGRLSMGCTGTLIADRWVLTAAHCVANAGGHPIGFALAQWDPAVCPLGTVYAKRVYVPNQYVGDENIVQVSFDYALVELWSTIPGAVPMTAAYVPWATTSQRAAYSVGYPGVDHRDGTLWHVGTQAFVGDNAVSLDGGASGTLETTIDGEGGQSGSPVYIFDGGVRKVVGVLVGSPVPACVAGRNWAARLTSGAMTHITNAMAPATLDFFWRRIDLPWAASKTGCP